MNNPEHTNPVDFMAEASHIVASLFGDEEKTKDAPPGSEALEDEARALETFINEDLARHMKADPDMAGITLHARIIELDRITGVDVPLWRVVACAEGRCGNPECLGQHHIPKRLLVTKRADGTYAALAFEEIFDKTEQNRECFDEPGTIKIDLASIIGNAVKEQIAKTRGDDDADEDDLPPAAKAKPAPVSPDPSETTAVLPVVSTDNTPPPWTVEGAAIELPIRNIDPRRDSGRSSLLRRAWQGLWKQ